MQEASRVPYLVICLAVNQLQELHGELDVAEAARAEFELDTRPRRRECCQ